VRGKVIAQGGTPEQARRAAVASRYKEDPEITYIRSAALDAFEPLLNVVEKAAGDVEVYLVGGAVRDAILGTVTHDLDFAVRGNATDVARRVAHVLEGDFFILDSDFDAARVILGSMNGPRDVLDFVAFRGGQLDDDLRHRDFTINALAYELRARTLLDPLGGTSDLRARIIRACSASSISEDPVRIVRAVRLAAALDFRIERRTRSLMRADAAGLATVSPERLRDEVLRILGGCQVEASIRELELLGTFPYLFPELTLLKGLPQSPPHVSDVWEHTLSTLRDLEEILAELLGEPRDGPVLGDHADLLGQHLSRYSRELAAHFAARPNMDRTARGLLFFAALYHDVGKAQALSVDADGRTRFLGHEQEGERIASDRAHLFRLSNDEVARIRSIVALHMRFVLLARQMEVEQRPPSRRAIHHFFRDAGDIGVDLTLLGLADLRGVHGDTISPRTWEAYLDVARLLLENYWERPGEAVAPPRLVDGVEVMRELGLREGPQVGEILRAIREAQADGTVHDRLEALALARRWMQRGASEASDHEQPSRDG
jgi:tRNA nucleotidyltransferase/poly(A) polymerase